MDEHDASLSIGAFARRVGLTPSALRFYDDCAILAPARVDQATGYRYYGEHQEPRGVLLRRLRVAGLPLAEVTTVLDGSPEDTRALLREHLHRMRTQADAARGAVEELLRSLRGDPAQLLVPADDLARLGGWAARAAEVAIEIGAGGARLRAGMESVLLPSVDGEFPAYRDILAGLGSTPHRIIVDREALRSALTEGVRQVVLVAEGERLVVRRESDSVSLPAICLGSPPVIAFDPAVLGPAVEAGVGPDVLLEVVGPAEPVVVRSADQGSFTTLVMPMKLDVPGGQ